MDRELHDFVEAHVNVVEPERSRDSRVTKPIFIVGATDRCDQTGDPAAAGGDHLNPQPSALRGGAQIAHCDEVFRVPVIPLEVSGRIL